MLHRRGTLRTSDSTKVHVCVLCLVLFVLYMVEYCILRVGFAIIVDLPSSVMVLTSEDKCDTV